MESPLFSIIIPVYNRAELIRSTLDTVASQTETSYEIVVVDDGSTDHTVSTVENHPLDVVLLQQENAGPGAARNTGIKAARGEYLIFLDSDDHWFPWTLATCRAAIECHNRPSFIKIPNVDMESHSLTSVTSSVEEARSEFDRGDFNIETALDTTHYQDFLAAAAQGIYVSSNAALVRQDEFNRTDGFTSRSINAEDHDLAFQLGTSPGFLDIHAPPLVATRTHDAQLTNDLKKTIRGLQYLLDKEKNRAYPGGERRKWNRRRLLSQHTRSASVSGLRDGHIRIALRLYTRTFSWNTRLMRWKYLVGFPILSLYESAKQAWTR